MQLSASDIQHLLDVPTSNSNELQMLFVFKRSFSQMMFPELFELINFKRHVLGIAQCLMCLWTHVGQKKTFDCSMRRNVGRFRLGCSFHLSYRESSSPRMNRRSYPKHSQSGNGLTNGINGYSGLKNFPRLDQTKLSSSLSSLRYLTDLSNSNGVAGS